MVDDLTNRRAVIAALASLPLGARAAMAAEYIDLEWRDLLHKGQTAIPPVVQNLIDHDEMATSAMQPKSSGVRTDWNGQIVRIPGFIVPIEYSGSGVSAFILVPFVGACIHVPPPPANQLVFVTTPEPYESSGLYEAVNVTGMFGTASMSTQLADIAYALSAEKIVPFSI